MVNPRPEVRTGAPAYHGALDFAELERLGLSPDDVLDFSVSSNPFGPSPRVREALAHVPLDRYPDREALALRRTLAERLEVPPQAIVVGNGASEILMLVALAFVRPGDLACIVGPTFGEYERVVRLIGGRVHEWRAQPENDFAVDVTAVAGDVHRLHPRLLFLCNPNNPTGQYLPPETFAPLVNAEPETLFVVDEAYLPFVRNGRSALDLRAENVLVVRSMTKAYALAGLRLGHAVGDERVVAALAAVRPAWNVNALAQAAGVAALGDDVFLRQALARLTVAKESLLNRLRQMGMEPVPSAAHFFLLRVGEAASFRRALLQKGILVRDCTSFGLPGHVRIGTRSAPENGRLIETIMSDTLL